MCTSSEISVTTNSIITARPSIWVPTVNSTPPFCHQVSVVHDRRDRGLASWPPASALKMPRPSARRPSLWPLGVVDPVDPLAPR